MKIEHFAYSVTEPGPIADWYCDHLGFVIKRSSDSPVPVRFLADETGQVMLEIYNNPKVTPPNYAEMDPLLLHIAFCCDNIDSTVERLVGAGATVVSGSEIINGDELAMLRDPWGLAIQLCKRLEPMI